MIIKLLFAFLSIAGNVFGQTENHKPIPGTKCSIIPPQGFVLSAAFSGFQKSDIGASIMVVELPGPYQSVIAGFTEEALKSKGMTLLDKQTVDFNNSKATLIKLSQPANGSIYLKQILVFGDSIKTVLVNGIYPEASKSIENEIKTSIFSTSYNEAQNENSLDAVAFKIGVAGSDFRFTKTIAGSLLYTKDGQVPTKSSDNATIIVSNSLSKVPIADKKQYSIERLKKMPGGESSIVKEVNPIIIDNLDGFEILAEGKDGKDKKQIIYFVMLFNNEGGYFVFAGSASGKFDSYLAEFKNIAKTFRRK